MNARSTPQGELPATVGSEGLVFSQQSLKPAKSFVTGGRGRGVLPQERALQRRRGLRKAVDHTTQQKPRWAVTVTDDQQTISIDTHEGRLRRCQKRIHAWASALPHDNRKIRRAKRVVKIGPRMVMLTLTYHDADKWEPLQIRDFMVALRAELGPGLLAYAWVLEMQARGAPHYHVLLYVKRGTKIPRPDDSLWSHGMSRIETAHNPYYICKYTSAKTQKAYQKEGFPAGARMFAVKIYDIGVAAETMLQFRTSAVPGWLRDHITEAGFAAGYNVHWKRRDGGGWLIVNTGEIVVSPWRVVSVDLLNGG